MNIDDILQQKYNDFNKNEKDNLYKMLFDSSVNLDLQRKIKQLIYIKEPPTPEEFLDWRNGWLTKGTSTMLREWVKESFCNIINNSNKYTVISFYGATRLGKSHLTRLLVYYTHVYINHLRNPQHFFGVSEDTNLAQYLICFNYKKTQQLLTSPIFNLIEKSPRTVKVKMRDQVKSKQAELGPDSFVYSTASSTGALTTSKNFQLQLGNASPLSLIGADIIQTYVTEIAYFIESEGATEDEIFRLYSDSVSRIRATMGRDKYLSWTLLDSSANMADSKIEKHILQDLSIRDDVYFIRMSQWECKELARESFPIWFEDHSKVFKVCTGNNTHPPKIITNAKELSEISKSLIIDVPIDAYDEFSTLLVKSIKDVAGYPSSKENKLIQDTSIIKEMFDESIENIEGILMADSMDSPEKLIWNQIQSKFFIKSNNKNLMIKRAHLEPRYLGVDFAYSLKGDVIGISCVHKERDFINEKDMYIVDFSFTIGTNVNEINLAAVEYFILELKSLGLLPIKIVTADSFQNKMFEQNLKRYGIEAKTLSVDRSLEPYLNLITLLFNRQIKAGKSIFLKNNLDSLIRTRLKSGKEKIDHSQGQTNNSYYGDWDNSTCGIHAKDCSDSLAAAIFSCYSDNILPHSDYRRENKKLSSSITDSNELTKDAFKRIHRTI